MSQIDIRGSSQFNKPATLGVIFFAWYVDVCAALFIFGLGFWILKFVPVLSLVYFVTLIAGTAVFLVSTHRYGISLGEKIWRVSLRKSLQKELLTPGIAGTGIFLTAVLSTLTFAVYFELIGKNPLLMQASTWEFESRLPNSEKSSDWVIAPFFYTMGSWPRNFDQRPVFYSLPYEKGPPTRYVGHIIARWKLPGTQVTFEGPKSPVLSTQENVSRDDLKKCLLTSRSSIFFGGGKCVRLRKLALDRHIEEISKLSPEQWNLRWFEVQQEHLPAEERTQGFYITAIGKKKEHHRVVLVTATGKHQTIFLDSPLGAEGSLARETFVKALQSLRVSDELAPGRALADQVIQAVKLEDISKITDPAAMVAKLAEVQAVLLGKISVDPKTFDAFFHLAGTALLLIRESSKNKLYKEDWIASAKPMIYSAYKYAQDIDPNSPKTAQIQNLWLESKKY
jgi:hypothetical protein